MEPLKALTFLAAVGVVSLVGAGAAGFYAGYSAARNNLDEIKAQIANAPVAIATGPGGTVSLKPVLEDIRALSKQVEALAEVKARPAADAEQDTKPVLDEIKALARQIDGLKASPAARASAPAQASGQDYTGALQGIREEVRALSAKLEKQDSKAPKALADEIHSLSASLHAQEPVTRRAIAEEVRSAVTVLQNAEPKAPKALIEEIRSLSASVQAQESVSRRVIAEEMRSAVTPLQNAEPKVPKALLDEIRTISANTRPLDGRPQVSVIDQIKILSANIESLKARLPERTARSSGGGEVGPEVAELRQLVATASDQFGKCQVQLASLAGAGLAQQQREPAAAASNTVSISQGARHEPLAVVFYDNVMLKKGQEKQYDEIGVKLALQSIAPRQIRVAINKQGFGLAFGERKVFRSQDVECELNLMETNLNDSQARVSISCKR